MFSEEHKKLTLILFSLVVGNTLCYAILAGGEKSDGKTRKKVYYQL